jgi:hypothetical protein
VLQASIGEDAEGPICKVVLLEGEHAEACQAWEVARRYSAACLTHRLMARGGY